MKRFRIPALAIAVVMVLSMFSATAFAAPANVQIVIGGNTGYTITASAAASGTGIHSYTWKIRPAYTSNYMSAVKTSNNHYTFSGLTPYTQYYISVDVTDVNGTTSSSELAVTSSYSYNNYYGYDYYGYNYNNYSGSYYGYNGLANVVSGSAKLYKSADSDADVYMTLPYGASLNVYSTTGDFYYISYGGYNGYVLRSAVSFYGSGNYYDPYYYSYLGYYDPYYYGYSGGYNYGYNTQIGTASVIVSSAAVYNGPTGYYSIIGYAYSGQTLPVYGTSGDFITVGYAGTIGYIHKSQLSMTSTTTVVPSTTTTTVVSGTKVSKYDSVNVRSSASVGASLLGTLTKGDVVSVLSYSGDWIQVSKGTLSGWVYKDNLQ